MQNTWFKGLVYFTFRKNNNCHQLPSYHFNAVRNQQPGHMDAGGAAGVHSARVQQEAREGVEVARVVADHAPFRQDDRHLVPGLQLHRHHQGGAVLAVPALLLPQRARRQAVDRQVRSGPQGAVGGVDGDGQAVDAGAGGGEAAGGGAVAVAQVEEDVPVEDAPVVGERAEAAVAAGFVEGDGEGAAAGWENK